IDSLKESDNFFDNDQFWWNENATDWCYLASESNVNSDDHPIYTPVHRYARNIIVSLDHWVRGWIDWNIVLDHKGGPNHVKNYCGASIMIDPRSGYIYYTPIFYILEQLSRTIRPGDKAVQVNKHLDKSLKDTIYSSASISDDRLLSIQLLNTAKYDIDCFVQVGSEYAKVEIDANSLKSIQVDLNKRDRLNNTL
ncbi:MAG: glycosyl hydrolase, partial [Nitrospinota bacterium]